MLQNFQLSMYYELLYELKYKYALTDEWSLELDRGRIPELKTNGLNSSLATDDIQELESLLNEYRELVQAQILYSDKESFMFLLENIDIDPLKLRDNFIELYDEGSKTLQIIEDNPSLLKIFSVIYNLEHLPKDKISKLSLFSELIRFFVQICKKYKSETEFHQGEVNGEKNSEEKVILKNLDQNFDSHRNLVCCMIRDFPL